MVKYHKYFLDKFWENHPEAIYYGFKGDGILNKDFGFVENTRKIIDGINDEFIIIMMDDHIIINDVNKKYVEEEVISLMNEHKLDQINIQGMNEYSKKFYKTELIENCFDYEKILKDTKFIYSLQPCIYRRNFILNIINTCLNNGINDPWSFETKGSIICNENCNDNIWILKDFNKYIDSKWEHHIKVNFVPIMIFHNGILHNGTLKRETLKLIEEFKSYVDKESKEILNEMVFEILDNLEFKKC
jgi:hypothetical protein